jgi:epoxyqueuosine reductase
MGLRERLVERAQRSGLVGLGICSAEPFVETRHALREAVASGRSGGMRFTFGDPATSSDVRSSFPWAKSIVVAAHAYLPQAGSPGPAEPGTGRVARFATTEHYEPLREGLGALGGVLTDAGHRAERLCDDNRLVDRAAAVRAGVGWWAKNAMVLLPGYGPWVLLGSVVTDAEMAVDEPMRRDCGTCSACLPACPTGALVAPGVLDARLCIAYWLQAPGSIPHPVRAAIGDRFYGCDDCIEACPPGGPLLVRSSARSGRVDMIGVLGADDRTLLERFRRFYVPRNDPRHLRRNALVVLGNSGDGRAVPVLAGYAGHADPLLREHAAWALGRIGGSAAAAVLEMMVATDEDPGVVGEAQAALAGGYV